MKDLYDNIKSDATYKSWVKIKRRIVCPNMYFDGPAGQGVSIPVYGNIDNIINFPIKSLIRNELQRVIYEKKLN